MKKSWMTSSSIFSMRRSKKDRKGQEFFLPFLTALHRRIYWLTSVGNKGIITNTVMMGKIYTQQLSLRMKGKYYVF